MLRILDAQRPRPSGGHGRAMGPLCAGVLLRACELLFARCWNPHPPLCPQVASYVRALVDGCARLPFSALQGDSAHPATAVAVVSRPEAAAAGGGWGDAVRIPRLSRPTPVQTAQVSTYTAILLYPCTTILLYYTTMLL